MTQSGRHSCFLLRQSLVGSLTWSLRTATLASWLLSSPGKANFNLNTWASRSPCWGKWEGDGSLAPNCLPLESPCFLSTHVAAMAHVVRTNLRGGWELGESSALTISSQVFS